MLSLQRGEVSLPGRLHRSEEPQTHRLPLPSGPCWDPVSLVKNYSSQQTVLPTPGPWLQLSF